MPTMGILNAILLALSLCADCFAVSMCSSVTLRRIDFKSIFKVALVFSIIQAGLLFLGWEFGNFFVGMISTVSHIIGFLLLLYVGGSMLYEGIKNKEEVRNLNGLKNIIIGGVATSIDALAVGVAQSMAGVDRTGFLPLFVSVFVVTAVSVVGGILGGKTLGKKFGRSAEICGGLVLVAIGVSVLLG